MKKPKQLERYYKGAANHRRLEIMFLVEKNQGLTLEQISERLGCNPKTISEHTQSLVRAGLLGKIYRGRNVSHILSPYGQRFVNFSKQF